MKQKKKLFFNRFVAYKTQQNFYKSGFLSFSIDFFSESILLNKRDEAL